MKVVRCLEVMEVLPKPKSEVGVEELEEEEKGVSSDRLSLSQGLFS
jgi:hypothetical protein